MSKTTECHTGPGCRLHSPQKSFTNDIKEQLDKVKKENRSAILNLFEQTKVRGGTNIGNDAFKDEYLLSREIQKKAGKDYYGISRYRLTVYETINAHLRGESLDRENNYVLEDIEQVDRVMFQYKTKINSPLYRTISFKNREDMGGLTTLQYAKEKFKIGSTFTEKAYSSTTIDPEFVTANTRKNKNHIVFEIIPKEGLFIFAENDLTNIEEENKHKLISQYAQLQNFEREVLLDRNSSFEVVDIKNIKYTNNYTILQRKNCYPMKDVKPEATYTTVQLIQK